MQERLIFKESAEEAASEQLVPQQVLPEQASRSPCLKANLYPLEASAEEMLQREQLRICFFRTRNVKRTKSRSEWRTPTDAWPP